MRYLQGRIPSCDCRSNSSVVFIRRLYELTGLLIGTHTSWSSRRSLAHHSPGRLRGAFILHVVDCTTDIILQVDRSRWRECSVTCIRRLTWSNLYGELNTQIAADQQSARDGPLSAPWSRDESNSNPPVSVDNIDGTLALVGVTGRVRNEVTRIRLMRVLSPTDGGGYHLIYRSITIARRTIMIPIHPSVL